MSPSSRLNNRHPLVQVMPTASGGIPHVSGQLQNMQISPTPISNVGGPASSIIDMMDPLMVPISMGVGNLDPQLQPSDTPFPISPAVSQSPVTTLPQYSTDFGHSVSGSTSLTEFTKRRNWSQRLLEELQDFLHILTPEMKIVYASPSGKALTGYETDELLGRVMTDFIHADDSGLFIREFHESATTGYSLRMFYRFKKKDNTYTVLETHGHPHFSEPHGTLGGSVGPKGFFMMARQYPTRNAALLDSFLEYKIEHERLTRRITELQKEESEDQQAQLRQRQAQLQQQMKDNSAARDTSSPNTALGTMAPPAKPGFPSTLLTRQNLDLIDATNPSKADNIRDKMLRFGDATYVEGIELLTGLRYREGERSRGISTGDTSPSLIRGDVGVPIPIDKESRHTSEKKKKQKTADEYVCTDCGTLDSPEWRKGPKGPKTLCNACGLRWAKKEKKKNATASISAQSSPMGLQNGLANGMVAGN